MRKQPTTFKSRALPRFLRATSTAGLLPALVLVLSIQSSHAGSATWKAVPATGDWNTAGNWTGGGPPNFNARANYKVDLNTTLATADQVAAKGVTIYGGATVTIGDVGTGTLTAGTVFTVIDNTAATAIAGTSSNLADGSTLIVGSNTYLVSYEGGTGNDLTLTVQ